MHIDHINISAPPGLLQDVRDFYCDVLGFTEGFRPQFSRAGFWLYSEDKPLIHLFESEEHFSNEKQGYFDHFALRATEITKVLQKLNDSDIKHRTSFLPDIGLAQIFCKDPSGTGVELNFVNELV
jgi:catechol 2,3-dioxygenase-like lactoylglutathione lyase family enzyme